MNGAISETPRLPENLLRECHGRQAWRHWLRLGIFAMLYFFAVAATLLVSALLGSPWSYVVCTPLYLLAAASLHGISLFTHEAVHGTLSRNWFWNDVLGAVCAMPVLQNCASGR